ncbi:hypothetical protein [Actinomadura sp. J1-007]|uniref:hypothetical protein n=1 Tax=Actinomadura sp. J1-007 TaxID=2661913 RepID=UPI0019D690FA|nr:hypothetical protein [Actinomadura sp. J1-007]
MLAHVTRDLIAGLLDDATAPFTLADLTDGRTAPWLGRWAALALPLMRDHDLAAQLEAPAGAPPGKPPVARNERWRLLPTTRGWPTCGGSPWRANPRGSPTSRRART